MLEDERSYLPLTRSPFASPDARGNHYQPADEESGLTNNKPRRSDTFSRPGFRRFTQASHLELFYDLFFVANLTVFTYIHEINDSDTLRQYIGFFCLLWFTWYQVSLHDVRFAMDSAFERVCKAVQLLVMMGFAICGPEFNVGEETNDSDTETPNIDYFQGLTIFLMISRLVLVVQYLQALFFTREYKKSILPIALIAIIYFVTAMVYLGLFWGLEVVNAEGDNHTYYTWYGLCVLETVLVTGISMKWRNLSFEGTHLVERMSLLTLIILGEGAIGTAKACQYITFSSGAFEFTGSVAAQIVCAVLILYFLYMIYFDWQHEEYFGVIRTQIWSFLHFPLHLALVLAVEGISQSITWNAAVRRSNTLRAEFTHWVNILFTSDSPTAQEFANAATSLNNTANDLIIRQLDRSMGYTSTSQGLAYLMQTNVAAIPTILNGAEDPSSAYGAFYWLFGALYNTVFKIAGFYTPETLEDREQTLAYLEQPLNFSSYPLSYWENIAQDNVNKSWTVFQITYTYFFISIGLAVVLLAVLAWFNRGRQTKIFWGRLLAMALVGVGLTLLSTMVLTEDDAVNFVLGPWILPTVTLCLFSIVLANSVRLPGLKYKDDEK